MSQKLTSLHSSALRIVVLFATFGVVFRHGQNLHHYYSGGSPIMPVSDVNIFIQEFISSFTDICIPCFFLISGFLFFVGLNDSTEIWKKLKRRVQTLLIPYILWNILFLILWMSLDQISALHTQLVSSFGIEYSFQWILNQLTVTPIVGQFWYIRTLILFSLFTPLLLLIYRYQILTLFCFGIFMLRWNPVDCSLFSSEGMVCFFLGGMIGFNSWHKNIVFIPKTLWLWLVVFILILFHFRLSFIGLWQLRIFLSMICLFQLALWFASKPVLREKLEAVGKYSFFIYALHGGILSAASLLLSRIVPHTPLISQGSFWLCVIGTILVIVLLAKIMQKILPCMYSLLTGGR